MCTERPRPPCLTSSKRWPVADDVAQWRGGYTHTGNAHNEAITGVVPHFTTCVGPKKKGTSSLQKRVLFDAVAPRDEYGRQGVRASSEIHQQKNTIDKRKYIYIYCRSVGVSSSAASAAAALRIPAGSDVGCRPES